MLAKDIMTTQVMTVLESAKIEDAMRLIIEIQISALIVNNEENDLVGVVTERDLLMAYDFMKNLKAPITDFIQRETISVSEDATVEEVENTLIHGNVRRVPVIRGSKVVGVISRRDIFRRILAENKHPSSEA